MRTFIQQNPRSTRAKSAHRFLPAFLAHLHADILCLPRVLLLLGVYFTCYLVADHLVPPSPHRTVDWPRPASYCLANIWRPASADPRTERFLGRFLSLNSQAPQAPSTILTHLTSTMDMPMSDSSSDSSTMEVMMIPWLHLTGGDSLYFKSLHPSSRGAIAAACVVLVLIAIFERWTAAVRGVLDRHWARA